MIITAKYALPALRTTTRITAGWASAVGSGHGAALLCVCAQSHPSLCDPTDYSHTKQYLPGTFGNFPGCLWEVRDAVELVGPLGTLLGFAWVYIFFSAGQVFLSALSWHSECISVSEGVFLMYPWREMYSVSTYFSAILFPDNVFLVNFSQIRKYGSWKENRDCYHWWGGIKKYIKRKAGVPS